MTIAKGPIIKFAHEEIENFNAPLIIDSFILELFCDITKYPYCFQQRESIVLLSPLFPY